MNCDFQELSIHAHAALSAKRGDIDISELSPEARIMYDHLTLLELEELSYLKGAA